MICSKYYDCHRVLEHVGCRQYEDVGRVHLSVLAAVQVSVGERENKEHQRGHIVV